MYRKFIITSAIILFYLLVTKGQPTDLSKAINKSMSSIFIVQTYDEDGIEIGLGTGFFIDSLGTGITNYHVLQDAKSANIYSQDGKKYPIRYVQGIDKQHDIIRFSIAKDIHDRTKIKYLKIATDLPTIGEEVFTIGNPSGLSFSASTGIISSIRKDEEYGQIIQTTTPISKGCSGSPLINQAGEVVGVISFYLKEGQNLNFAFSSQYINQLNLEQIYFGFPEYVNAYNSRGNVKNNLGDQRRAIQDCNKAIKLDPKNSDLYLLRGLAKANLDDHRGAIQDYNKAIELNPEDTLTYLLRGLTKAKLDDHRGAIQDYTRAIELNPEFVFAYFNRGLAKDDLGDHRGAIQDYTRAIELNPGDAGVYNGRGLAKANLDDHRGAIQDYTKAIELDSKYVKAYYNRGSAKDDLGDHRGAIQDYNKAIELNPEDVNAYNNRGVAKSELGDYRGAIQDYTKAIKLDPKDSYAYILRGFDKMSLGDKEGACLDWSKAGELGEVYAYDLIKEYCNSQFR